MTSYNTIARLKNFLQRHFEVAEVNRHTGVNKVKVVAMQAVEIDLYALAACVEREEARQTQRQSADDLRNRLWEARDFMKSTLAQRSAGALSGSMIDSMFNPGSRSFAVLETILLTLAHAPRPDVVGQDAVHEYVAIRFIGGGDGAAGSGGGGGSEVGAVGAPLINGGGVR